MSQRVRQLLDKLDDPRSVKKIHGTLAIIWFVASFPIMIFLRESIVFLVFISVYAIVASHWAGWDASGAELEIDKIKRKLDSRK